MKYKFGVIGYGFIGRRHVSTLKSLGVSDCTAVCDINPKRLDEAKEKYPDIAVYDNAEDMLKKADMDGVIISTNNNQHKNLTIQAARAKKHILCEKPAALSVTDLDEMLRAAKDAGVTFTAHHQRRFDKDFRSVKECYDKRLVGDTYLIKSMLYGYNGNMHDWHVYKSEGGGMLYDWGVHLIDQILFMIDSPLVSVFADVRNVINNEVDDYFKIILRFENKVTAEIELGTYYLSDQKDWFERHWNINGNKGCMYVNKFEAEGKLVRTAHLLENVKEDQEKSAASYGPTRSFGIPEEGLILTEDIPHVKTEHLDYFRNYFKALGGEEEFLVKPEQIRKVLQVMEACRKSSETMKSIVFE
jgi:predicted dehydrogenase